MSLKEQTVRVVVACWYWILLKTLGFVIGCQEVRIENPFLHLVNLLFTCKLRILIYSTYYAELCGILNELPCLAHKYLVNGSCYWQVGNALLFQALLGSC